jgi:hypothetical protein
VGTGKKLEESAKIHSPNLTKIHFFLEHLEFLLNNKTTEHSREFFDGVAVQ